jgi:hypothetical protein
LSAIDRNRCPHSPESAWMASSRLLMPADKARRAAAEKAPASCRRRSRRVSAPASASGLLAPSAGLMPPLLTPKLTPERGRRHFSPANRRLINCVFGHAGFWGAPVAAGSEARRREVTHSRLTARKDDAVQQGVVDLRNERYGIPALRLEVGRPDHLAPPFAFLGNGLYDLAPGRQSAQRNEYWDQIAAVEHLARRMPECRGLARAGRGNHEVVQVFPGRRANETKRGKCCGCAFAELRR